MLIENKSYSSENGSIDVSDIGYGFLGYSVSNRSLSVWCFESWGRIPVNPLFDFEPIHMAFSFFPYWILHKVIQLGITDALAHLQYFSSLKIYRNLS